MSSEEEIPDSPAGMGNEQAQRERPDHPAFWQLSEIAIGNDTAVKDDPAKLTEILEAIMPKEVVTYVAAQRGRLICEKSGVPNDHDVANVIVPTVFLFAFSTGSWIDGFAMGAAWQKKYGGKSDA